MLTDESIQHLYRFIQISEEMLKCPSFYHCNVLIKIHTGTLCYLEFSGLPLQSSQALWLLFWIEITPDHDVGEI